MVVLVDGKKTKITTRATLPYLLGKLTGKRLHGITLGRHIRLTGHAMSITPQLLAHEIRHVQQRNALGLVKFAWRYVKELWRYGYGLNMPLEKDAYDYALASHADWAPTVALLQTQAR